MALSKFFDNNATNSKSSFPLSTGSSDSTLSLTSFFLSLDSSFNYILNVSRDPISSSSLILFKYLAFFIVVALSANLGGKDLRAFFTSSSSEIFSLRATDSLAISHNFPLKSLIVSSSLIHRFSNKKF